VSGHFFVPQFFAYLRLAFCRLRKYSSPQIFVSLNVRLAKFRPRKYSSRRNSYANIRLRKYSSPQIFVYAFIRLDTFSSPQKFVYANLHFEKKSYANLPLRSLSFAHFFETLTHRNTSRLVEKRNCIPDQPSEYESGTTADAQATTSSLSMPSLKLQCARRTAVVSKNSARQRTPGMVIPYIPYMIATTINTVQLSQCSQGTSSHSAELWSG